MKKTIVLVLIGLLLVSAVVFAQKAAAVDIKTVPNGTYSGTYSAGSYAYEAIVTVEGGKLMSVKLVKAPNKSVETKSAAAFDTMVKQNSVDAVSGATWKALVNNALTKQTPYKK